MKVEWIREVSRNREFLVVLTLVLVADSTKWRGDLKRSELELLASDSDEEEFPITRGQYSNAQTITKQLCLQMNAMSARRSIYFLKSVEDMTMRTVVPTKFKLLFISVHYLQRGPGS